MIAMGSAECIFEKIEKTENSCVREKKEGKIEYSDSLQIIPFFLTYFLTM